jgi:hypothetical protein
VYGGGGDYLGDAFVAKLSADGRQLCYSTYLGGSDGDVAYGLAVDGDGQAYVTGYTFSTNFPVTAGAFQPVFGGGLANAFVAKLSADGHQLRYSTYLGGSTGDVAYGLAVDGDGQAYVTGYTFSTNFPVTAGAFQPVFGGGLANAFVAKLSADGRQLRYSTYLGGSEYDLAYGIAVDGDGQAYVAGGTFSTNFPVTVGAFQPVLSSSGSGFYSEDAFVAQLSADGTALVYSTYLGGGGYDEWVFGIAVDGHGQAYVAGETDSTNFPVTAGAFQPVYGGGSYDAFVAQLSADGSQLLYATYLGGDDYDHASGIAVDGDGQAYVTGYTHSTNFPVTAGIFQPVFGGGYDDAFVAQLSFADTTPCGEISTAGINVRRSGYRRSRTTGHYLQQLTLTNTGSAPITGPLVLVLDNLSSNATVANGSGQTACAAPVGSPYVSVTLSGNTLNPGQSVAVSLELANPTNQAMSYTTRVLVLSSPPA